MQLSPSKHPAAAWFRHSFKEQKDRYSGEWKRRIFCWRTVLLCVADFYISTFSQKHFNTWMNAASHVTTGAKSFSKNCLQACSPSKKVSAWSLYLWKLKSELRSTCIHHLFLLHFRKASLPVLKRLSILKQGVRFFLVFSCIEHGFHHFFIHKPYGRLVKWLHFFFDPLSCCTDASCSSVVAGFDTVV